jgi:hypothetical protein
MLEHVVANISGQTRREIFKGREHIVAPLSLVVVGVLNGSRGPLFYPREELARHPSVWNGIPIVVYHPILNGKPISAQDPDVLNKQSIGVVLRSRMVGDKLVAEGWFDIELMQSVDKRVLNSLDRNEPIELSTGLVTDTEPGEGVFNGVEYSGIAKNYQPDHLAILPDMVGACSIKDGCGVLVNDGQNIFQMPKESQVTKKTDAQRKAIADFMIANCECWEETDREVLNAMTDEKLDALKDHVEKVAQAEVVANAARKGFEHGDIGFVFNEKDLVFIGKEKPKAKPERKEEPVTNLEVKKPVTADEWMAAAPPEIQSVVRNAMESERQQKEALIEVILANKSNVFKKEHLLLKPVDELTAIAALAKVEEVRPSYFGSAVPATNQKVKVDENDFLPLPTINWKEEAKSA